MVESSPDRFESADALREYLSEKFPTARQTLTVGPFEFDFLSVADPHDHMDALMGEEIDGDYQWEPFWAQAWPSADLLAQWMLDQDVRGLPDWSGSQVLDLGCGVGLNGCLAAAKNARVCFADYAEPSLLFATYNSWPWRHRVSTAVVDWHRDNLEQSFDVILGADIVYEERNWESLDRFFKAHLRSKGEVWLTEPGRETGEQVQPFLESRGWSVFPKDLATLDNGRPLRLLVLRLA